SCCALAHHLPTSLTPFFLSHPPAPPEIYTLSLHDALPIFGDVRRASAREGGCEHRRDVVALRRVRDVDVRVLLVEAGDHALEGRSEEHTSELQSLAYLVCRLLLEKKKKKK